MIKVVKEVRSALGIKVVKESAQHLEDHCGEQKKKVLKKCKERIDRLYKVCNNALCQLNTPVKPREFCQVQETGGGGNSGESHKAIVSAEGARRQDAAESLRQKDRIEQKRSGTVTPKLLRCNVLPRFFFRAAAHSASGFFVAYFIM